MDMDLRTSTSNMTTLKILLDRENKFMHNTIFQLILAIYQTLQITENKVIPLVKLMDMDLKISTNSMIILKILLGQESRFMLNMISQSILAIYQTLQITESKAIQSVKLMDMDLKISTNSMIILKILLGQESRFMLNMISQSILAIYKMLPITDNKVM
jgi:hypothetical protein